MSGWVGGWVGEQRMKGTGGEERKEWRLLVSLLLLMCSPLRFWVCVGFGFGVWWMLTSPPFRGGTSPILMNEVPSKQSHRQPHVFRLTPLFSTLDTQPRASSLIHAWPQT